MEKKNCLLSRIIRKLCFLTGKKVNEDDEIRDEVYSLCDLEKIEKHVLNGIICAY